VDVDVEAVMLRLLKTQKEYVCKDLEKYSEAMVAVFPADGKFYVQFPDFQDELSKTVKYAAIVERAKSERATIIITVNHAFSRMASPLTEFEEVRWGDFNKHNARRCILLTASGPGLESCSLAQPYDIVNGSVMFDELEWLTAVELGMLPGWPDESPSPVQ
jgi:hypothetical protein